MYWKQQMVADKSKGNKNETYNNVILSGVEGLNNK